MSLRPIVLHRLRQQLASDDACTTIVKYELHPAPSTIRPSYQSPHDLDLKLRYVPPLTYFCINALAQYPDELHALGPTRLRYQAARSRDQFDILAAFIPTYCPFSDDTDSFDLRIVDPRLWAVLIQVFESLPPAFRQYTLPLSDVHLPMLQTIPNTKHFALLTVLSLSRCRELTDDNVMELRHLHTLAALNASVTALGTWGVRRLAQSLVWSEAEPGRPAERRGPWGLRILDLRDCINVDDQVYHWLRRFPLLSVVDLRGTTCKPWRHPNLPFKPSYNKSLYHPADLTVALERLKDTVKNPRKTPLFSHPAPFMINIDALYHKPSKFNPATHPLNNLYRDIDSEDEELSEPTSARGRRDVFTPYEPPRQAPPCSTTAHESPQHTYPGLSEASDQMYKPREYHRGNLIHEDYECDCGSACYGGCDCVCPEHGGLFAPSEPTEPSDMDYDGWGEGLARRTPSLEPDPGDDRDSSAWLDDTADYERRAFAREYGADKFYTVHARRHAVAAYDRSGGRPRDPHGTMSTSGAGEKTDPLMLFRTPPPWSVLPSAPPAKPAPSVPSGTGLQGSTSSIPAPADDNGAKRKRTEHDDIAPADQARRRMHALSSIQSMLSLVQKRADKPADGGVRQVSGARVTMPGRVNPFARAAQAGRTGVKRKVSDTSLEEGPSPSTSASTLSARTLDSMIELSPAVGGSATPARATPRLARPTATPLVMPAKPARPQRKPQSPPRPQARPPLRPQPGPSSSSALSERQSDGTAPSAPDSERKPKTPRPPKKLKPITTLKVPDLPIEFRPLSHYKPKPPPAPPRKPSVQTTLPVSRGPARVAVAPGSASKPPPDKEPKEKRRTSAPVVSTRRINMVVETPGKGGTGQGETGASNTGKRVKGKERKGECFDWKKWGTG